MAKKYKYIVRVTVVTEEKKTRAEIRARVQKSLDSCHESMKATASVVDLQ